MSELCEGMWGEMEDILPTIKNASDEITSKIGTKNIESKIIAYMYDVQFPKWVYEEIPLLESEFFKQDLAIFEA